MDPTAFLAVMANLASLSTKFLEALSSKMSENEVSSKLVTFLENLSIRDNQYATSSLKCLSRLCPRAAARQTLIVHRSMCDFVIKVGFLSRDSVCYSTLLLALDLFRDLSISVYRLQCRAVSSPLSPLVLLEESSTPFENGSSRHWKEHLANDLLGDVHSRYAKIINVVELVCRDLEHRCTTVERPLREAEINIGELERTIEEFSRNNLVLKGECSQLRRELEDRQGECAAAAHELRCAKTEIEGCHKELQNGASARERAQADFESEKGGWREKEAQFVATIRVHEDGLKDLHLQLEDAQSTVWSL